MENNPDTENEHINDLYIKFGIIYENQFVVLDDAKHVIGVYSQDPGKLIFRDAYYGFLIEFEKERYINYSITNLVYDDKTRSLFSGNNHGRLFRHKVDAQNKTCPIVKDYGNLGIGSITSSDQFLHLVFFGGNRGKIRVFDVSTDKLLSGYIETSIRYIYSLQVCVKSHEQIHLAVSGAYPDYSEDKTDLFDLTDFLLNDPIIFKKLYLEYSIDELDTILKQRSTIQSQANRIKSLTRERDSYRQKLNELQTKYEDLQKKNDLLQKQNTQAIKAFKLLKTEFEKTSKDYVKKINLLYQHKSKRTTIGAKKSLIGNRWFDETDPLVIIRDLKEDLQDAKLENQRLENSMFDVLIKKKKIEKESQAKSDRINGLQNQLIAIQQVVGQR